MFDAIDRKAVAKVWSGNFDAIWRPGELSTVHFKVGYTEAHGRYRSRSRSTKAARRQASPTT